MNPTLYTTLLVLHVLGATIWTGGHLVLAVTVLPRALRAKSAQVISDFEEGFERLGIPALFVQIVTGLWLAYLRLGAVHTMVDFENPLARVVLLKLACLAATAALAVHARFFIIPKLTNETLPTLAWHIVPVTLLSVVFAVAGVLFRGGGIG